MILKDYLERCGLSLLTATPTVPGHTPHPVCHQKYLLSTCWNKLQQKVIIFTAKIFEVYIHDLGNGFKPYYYHHIAEKNPGTIHEKSEMVFRNLDFTDFS